MWAEVYERSFVNVRHVSKRNYAALGCCAEVYENVGRGLRTIVRKCGKDLRTPVRKHTPVFTHVHFYFYSYTNQYKYALVYNGVVDMYQ